MQPFFITGLPRSRTAWVSNWLTSGSTVCFHDVEAFPGGVPVVGIKQAESGMRQVGFAGPETAKDFDQATRVYPDAPWLVIRRNSREAFAAFLEWAGDDVKDHRAARLFWDQREELLNRIIGHSRTMVVATHELDREPLAERMWEHLRVMGEFDPIRWAVLRTLNVQQDKEKAKSWRLRP